MPDEGTTYMMGRDLTEERVAYIEALEMSMGMTSKGKPRTLFRPYRHGGAVGIREVWRWAKSPRGKYIPDDDQLPLMPCDSRWCGS